jgi:hypothetical protein
MQTINIAINVPTIVFLSIILLITGACLFFIGYFIGKQGSLGVYNTIASSSSNNNSSKPVSFFDKNNAQEQKVAITIDTSKFVTDIKTDGLEKKYANLGEIKESEENISGSINKLKNMKNK